MTWRILRIDAEADYGWFCTINAQGTGYGVMLTREGQAGGVAMHEPTLQAAQKAAAAYVAQHRSDASSP